MVIGIQLLYMYLVVTSSYEDYGPWRPSCQGYYRQGECGLVAERGGETGAFS